MCVKQVKLLQATIHYPPAVAMAIATCDGLEKRQHGRSDIAIILSDFFSFFRFTVLGNLTGLYDQLTQGESDIAVTLAIAIAIWWDNQSFNS